MLHFYLTLLDLITLLLRGSFLKGAKELKKKNKNTLHWRRPREKHTTLREEFWFGFSAWKHVSRNGGKHLVGISHSLLLYFPSYKKTGSSGQVPGSNCKAGWGFPSTAERVIILYHCLILFSCPWTSILQLIFSPVAWSSPAVLSLLSTPLKATESKTQRIITQ